MKGRNRIGLALQLMMMMTAAVAFPAAADVTSVRTSVEGKPKQEYFLIRDAEAPEPEDGYKLLLVLPGGDGSAEFNPFVTQIARRAVGPEFVVAQLVAVKWTSDQSIVWPTGESEVEDAEFTTEEFIEAVIGGLRKSHPVDPRHVYTLSWSSSGPAAYAAALEVDEVKGSFIAMSVFKPELLPRLSRARGHRFYLHHSPDDRVCPFRMAEQAKERLSSEGAEVELVSYGGGHGWRGDVFAAIKSGMAWLEDEDEEDS